MKVKYAIDNFFFESGARKIYVTESKGLLDSPKPKEPFKVSYPNRDGEEVYFGTGNKMVFEPKQIELSCVIVSASAPLLISDFNALVAVFRGTFAKRLKRLYVQVDSGYPLVYDVYLSDEISLTKKWNDGQMVGTFTLKFTEPMPTKTSYHLSAYDFTSGVLTGQNLLTDSFINTQLSCNSVSNALRQVSVTAGKTYTLTAKAKKNDTKSATVIIHKANSFTWHLDLVFENTFYEIKSVTFVAALTETLWVESFCIPSGGASEFVSIDWYVLSEGAVSETIWSPMPTEPVVFSLTLTNKSQTAQICNVACDGLTVDSIKSITVPAGIGFTASANFSFQCEFINSFLKNPVFTIDNTNVTVTATKPFLIPYSL